MGYTLAQARAFIDTVAPLIRAEAEERGYRTCAAVIAQAVVESAAGTSGLARYHNYFGLKCGSSWKGGSVNLKTKEEYKVGTLTTIRDNFRTYPTLEDGIKGYYDFISTKRYANLKTATDYRAYAQMLKADGYATSSTYVNTLCSVVEKYGLTQWDKAYSVPTTTRPTLRQGSRGGWVKELQTLLNYHSVGCNLTVDGIMGQNTVRELIKYQGLHGLVKDGICGKLTWAELYRE